MDPSQRYRPDRSDLLRKPMVGDDGLNPFAEPTATPDAEAAFAPVNESSAANSAADNSATGKIAAGKSDGAENVYAAPAQGDSQPIYRPHGYVPTLVPRSGRVLTFGVSGLLIALSCLAGHYYSLPFALANLGLTVGAWLIGKNELKAIRAGAVVGSNRGQALTGMILGILGTLVSLAAVAAFFYRHIPEWWPW